METAYISILIKSLEEKNGVLDKILALNKQQKIFLQNENLSPEELEQNLDYKAGLVRELERLDEGFETTFSHVQDILKDHKEQYASEIGQMQGLIKEIMEKTNAIQVQEVRNKQNALDKFAKVRSQVKGVRKSQRVVNQYYQNMRRQRESMMTQVIDDKK